MLMSANNFQKPLFYSFVLLCFCCLGFVAEPVQAQCAVGQLGGPGVFYEGCTQTNGSAANTTITPPAGTAVGDVLIVNIVTDGTTNPTPSVVGAWSWLGTDVSGGAVTMSVWSRTADAGDAAGGTHTFNFGATERFISTYMRFSSTVEADIVTASQIGTSTQPQAPTVNTLQNDSLVLRLEGNDRRAITASGGFTNMNTGASGGGSNGVYTSNGFTNEPLGATGAFNFNTITSDQWVGRTVALRPPPPPVAFRIEHSGSGSTCTPTTVTITAVNAGGGTVGYFTGQVNITAPNGNWAPNSTANPGSFVNDDPGDGDFTYTFTSGDAGSATFDYYPAIFGTLDIDIVDDATGTITENSDAQGVDQQMSVAQCGFTLSHDGALGTCDPFEPITITAVESDGSTVRGGFTGTVTINTSSTPGTWAIGGSGAQGSINDLGNGNIEYTFGTLDGGSAVLEFSHGVTATVSFTMFDEEAQDADLTTGGAPDLVVAPCGFLLTHDGTAGTCGFEYITLTSTSSSFNSTVFLTTSTTDGLWSVETGSGTLTVLPNGNMSYAFDASTQGAVHVFRYTQPTPATVDFDISETAVGLNESDFGLDPQLSVGACKFVISSSGSPDNCSIYDVTFQVQDASNNAVTGYTGTVTIDTSTVVGNWSQVTSTNSPDNSPTPGNGVATIDFALADAGTVVLGLSHDDPGAVTIDANDATNGITTPAPLAVNVLACSFWVSLTSPGNTCTPNDVTIEVRNGGGSLITNYSGTATITTTSGNGDWTLGGSTDTVKFTNLGGGAADYFFDGTEEGSITLELSDPIVETINIGVTDGLLVVDGAHNPSLSVQACKFLISHTGSTDLCTPEAVTFTLVDSADNPVSGYDGQIFISSSNSGTWTDGTTSGIVDTTGGSANYQFTGGGTATATFNFQGNVIATYDFDVTDGSNTDNDGDPTDDPDLDITACLPVVTGFSCVNANSTSITIPSAAETLNSRAVVMVTGKETAAAITTANFNGLPSTGNVISLTNTGNPANTRTYTEMFAWLESDLPAAGGLYTGDFTVDNGQAMCLIGLKNVNQALPVAPAIGSSTSNAGGVISSSLTSPAADSIVISGASVDELGGFGVNSLGNQFGNFSVASDSWSFSAGWGVAADTGTVTVTENFLGTNDRYTHIIAAFAPAPAPLSYFTITHDGFSTSCTNQEITITAYDVNGNIKTDYVGTISLSTDLNNGNWTQFPVTGTLTDTPGDDDGMATYEFVSGDNGAVTLNFVNPHNETIEFSVADGGITDDNSQPSLVVSSCEPIIGDTQCYSGLVGSVDIFGSETSSARAVIMSIARESVTGNDPDIDPTSVVFDGQQMSFIATAEATTGGTINTTDMYVIFDADLPTAAGTYNASFSELSGTFPNTPGMCLTSVYGIEQSVPVAPAVGTNTVTVTPTDSTVNITTAGNNALLLSIASEDSGGGTFSSDLDTEQWNYAPAGGGITFGGFTGSKAQGGPAADTMVPSGTPTMISHILASFAPVVAGPATADDFVPVTLFQTYAGPINYRAYGSPYRTQPNGVDPCLFVDPATGSDIEVDIPAGATFIASYMYWSGSGDDDLGQTDSDVTLVTPGPSSFGISADETFLIKNVGGGNNLDFFAGYKDVSAIVNVNGTYTMQDMVAQSGAPWQATQACAAGWAMVVVYEHPNEEIKVINLFHGFQPFQNSEFELVPRNFRLRASLGPGNGLPHGQITHITIEGDDTLGGANERFGLQDAPGSSTFNYLVNSFNPLDSQYNSTVTRPIYDGLLVFDDTAGVNGDGYESLFPAVLGAEGDSFGVDVDTHYLEGDDPGDPLYAFGIADPLPEQITTEYAAGQDLVLLVNEVISVTNSPIVDLEATLTEDAPFVVGGTSSYTISLVNNGDGNGSDGNMTGSATVTITLPDGFSFNAAPSATGWNCVFDNAPANTPLMLPALACEYDISTPIAEGGNLPPITIEIAIAGELTFPNLVNQEDVIVRALYHGGNCTPDPLDNTLATFGTSPDPDDCNFSPQFDNVQDLEGGALSMNDLVEKSASNNNVDGITTTVNGRQTDLQIAKVSGVLVESSIGTYTITVTNLGPDITTKTMTITDTLPAGLTYAGFAENGDNDAWSCGAVGQNVTCTTATSLTPGDNADVLLGVLLSAPAIENSNVSNTACASIAAGNFDTNAANDCDTDSKTVQGEPVASQNKFLFSVNTATPTTTIGSVTGTLSFTPQDIILYDPATDVATMFFDDSAVNGDAAQNVNALHIRKNGHIILSSANDGSSIAGVSFDSGDLVVYDPIGPSGMPVATLLFDGSTVFNGGIGNIDAIYEQDDGDLIISTAEATGIGATTWQEGDWIEIDGATPTISTVFLDGEDAAVFNAVTVQLDGTYFKAGNTPDYVITIGQTSANIATGNTTFTGDDIASLQVGVDSQIEFRGSVPNGVFDPLLSGRFIDGIHLVEDQFFGHFSIIESVSGNTCTPTQVVISKHTFDNSIDTTYTGSIRINMDYGGTATISINTGDGTLTNTTGNEYIYTFVPTDMGQATFALTVQDDGVNVNLDVSNGLRTESNTEDPIFTFNDVITAVSYGDNFATNDYSNNSGSSSFTGPWTETDADDGAEDPGVGNVQVIGTEVFFDNTPNSVDNSGGTNDDFMPAITRSLDLSLYELANTLTLTFDWRTVSANSSDSFIVEVRGDGSLPTPDPWLEVNTFTGLTGSNFGSESYDLSTILVGNAQVVSANTEIRFRVEDNYDVTGNFIIDDVLLTTGTADCGVGSVHHYDIIHIGSGVMCEAYPITFVAHDVAHTPVAPGLSTVVNLTTSSGLGSWSAAPGYPNLVDAALGDGAATYTFQVAESSFQAVFNLTAPNVSAATSTINFNIAQGVLTEQSTTIPVDPDFNFVQAGFVFYDAFSSANPSAANKTLGTQIAGKFSSATPTVPIVIRAVRTDIETMACIAQFANQTVTIEMGAECKDPGACLAGNVTVVETGPSNQVIPTSTDNSDANTVAADIPITLDFNADGEAEIDMMYTDAGEIQLYAEYDIRLDNDPAGLQSGDIMYGLSDPFVVRPFGFNIDLSANLSPTISVDANGTAFQRAGQPFSINLQAVAYDSADDVAGGPDGIPDSGADLTDNALTPNFGNVSVTPTVTITHEVVLPVGAGAGTLSGSTSFDNFSAGQELHTDIVFSEVGILNLTATLSAAPGYLNSGVGIEGNIQNIGRFTPNHYTISMVAHQDRGALGAACMQPSTFTYMGEDLGFVFDIEARNSGNSITQNYFGGFDKLDTNGEINFTALDTMTMDVLTGQLDTSSLFTFGWGANPGVDTGEGTISGTLVLDKAGSPEGPYNDFAVGIVPFDEDGINMRIGDLNLDGDLDLTDDTFQLLSTSMRYGRLAINSAAGSEISISTVSGTGADVPITLEVEYFDSVQGIFINNGIDDCSPFDSASLSVVNGSYTDGLTANPGGVGTPTLAVNVSPLSGTVGVLDNGRTSPNSENGVDPDPPMYLSSPFAADDLNPQTGSVVIELNLDALGLDFLKFNWYGDNPADPYDETPDVGNVEDNPRAIVDFGLMPGHNRVINWQELIPVQ